MDRMLLIEYEKNGIGYAIEAQKGLVDCDDWIADQIANGHIGSGFYGVVSLFVSGDLPSIDVSRLYEVKPDPDTGQLVANATSREIQEETSGSVNLTTWPPRKKP